MAIKQKLTKADRISKEERRVRRIYKNINPERKASIDGLIQRAAYMRVTLEDYENDLDIGGSVELFTQSVNTAPYERERPVARLYNTMNKNYQCIIKQLTDLVNREPDKEPDDKLLDFLKE